MGDRSAFADAATYRFQGARPSCRAFVYVVTVAILISPIIRNR